MNGKQNLFYIQNNHIPKSKGKSLMQHSLGSYYISNQARKQANSDSNKDDLYRCMRILLIFGKVIGLVPLSGLFSGKLETVNFRKFSLNGIISFLIITILSVNEGISLYAFMSAPAKDASQIAKNAGGFVCYGIGLYVFIFMYRNCSKLLRCFHQWRDTKTIFYKQDNRLFQSITLVSGIIYTSAILENLTSHWKYFKGAFVSVEKAKDSSQKVYSSVWENYYVESHSQHANIIPYNIVVSIGTFLCNKWAVYAWNFGDILVAVIARAFYKRFRFNYEDYEAKLYAIPGAMQNEAIWLQAVKDHENLVSLLEEFASLLSPLIFACVSTNIYFICLVLNSFLVPNDSDVVSNVYEAWAFVHLLARTYITILCCAKVNDYAHKLVSLLSKCPVSVYTKEVERTVLNLRTTEIGLGGLGCFIITKPFILSAFSVIFTFEIVLLQSTMAPVAPSNTSSEVK